MQKLSLLFFMSLCFLGHGEVVLSSISDPFPLRSKYSEIPVLSTVELANLYQKAIIIDVRSKLEYEVIHIKNSLHIPIARLNFLSRLEDVRGRDNSRPIVFYCNGHTCAKSYKASAKALESGFTNVYAYDSGIFDWTTDKPEYSVLLGNTPVEQKDIINSDFFNSKLISFNLLKEKCNHTNSILIDIREPYQKLTVNSTDKMVDIPKTRCKLKKRYPTDRLKVLLKRNRYKENQMLIYDAVGKQVRWLQYYLNKLGYTNYFFLENGVKGTL